MISAAAWPPPSAAIAIVSALSSAGRVFSVAIAVDASTLAVILPLVGVAIFKMLATVAVPVIVTAGLPIEIFVAVIASPRAPISASLPVTDGIVEEIILPPDSWA